LPRREPHRHVRRGDEGRFWLTRAASRIPFSLAARHSPLGTWHPMWLNVAQSGSMWPIGRLAILADLYQEQGEVLFKLDQPDQGSIAFARALRFILEVTLSEAGSLSSENIGKVEVLVQRLKGGALPVETQLALSDYYQRLLEKDDRSLAAAGTSRAQVSQALARLQVQLGPSQNPTGD